MKSLNPKKFNKYLAIGTVVILINGIRPLMIIGYNKKNTREEDCDYISVPYPEGFISNETVFAFNHSDIALILSLGHMNKNYLKYDDFLNKRTKIYKIFE